VAEALKRFSVRFATKRKRGGERAEVAYMYDSMGSLAFRSYCERSSLVSFLERLGAEFKRSRSGKTIYLEGEGAEEAFRRLLVFSAVRQCTRSPAKVLDVADAVAGLSEFEAVFWYTKLLSEYERRGYWGVCRVARAFRVLNRID